MMTNIIFDLDGTLVDSLAGHRLWVVTNKPDHVTGMILRHLAANGYFEEVMCRDSRTPPFGSKAEMLSELLSRRELDRAETMMVTTARHFLPDPGASAGGASYSPPRGGEAREVR